MRAFITSLDAACREHPWMVPGILLSGSAALGIALPDLIGLMHRLLS